MINISHCCSPHHPSMTTWACMVYGYKWQPNVSLQDWFFIESLGMHFRDIMFVQWLSVVEVGHKTILSITVETGLPSASS